MQNKQATLRERLIEAAQNERLLRYGGIAPSLGLDMSQVADRREIGQMLDAINRVEHDAGRPLLSAVVVQTETNMPGEGFFPMAERLGYEVGDDWQAFWAQEVARVYSYWAGRPDGLTDEQPIRARAGETVYELSVARARNDVVLTLIPQAEADTDSQLVLQVYLPFAEATKLGIRLQGRATEAQFNQGQGQGNDDS